MKLRLNLALACTLLAAGGCASTTTFQLTPSPQKPVCDRSARAMAIWTTQWRPDQKDVAAREAAAAEGLGRFFQESGCFQSATLRRWTGNAAARAQEVAAEALARQEKTVLIVLRELGPTVKIGASLALVEGGTEVVLDLAEYGPGQPIPRAFTVHWRSGGPGVLKGVATLPQDLQAALAAGLQPPAGVVSRLPAESLGWMFTYQGEVRRRQLREAQGG